MNKFVMMIILLLIFVSSLVVAQGYEEYTTMTIQETISNTIQLSSSGPDFRVSSLTAKLHAYPKNSFRQLVINQDNNPSPQEQVNTLFFEWDHPNESEVSFVSTNTVQTKGTCNQVHTKVSFPMTNIPQEVHVYVEETEHITANQDMRNLANELAGDSDDAYEVVFNIAEWVNKNIEYDLSTLTSEIDQSAIWVYEQRYGVCDEITNLFISFVRSLGIPARFVSGIAYTDSELFSQNWGNHGWAEVYFVGVGWVPFDVTYEQYGYVDATHIEMLKAVDGTSPSVEYSSTGIDYVTQPEQLQFETEVISQGEKIPSRSDVSISMLEPHVGFDSYNVVEVQIKNPHDFYVVETVTLSQTNNMNIIGTTKRRVLLKPGETKITKWLVQVKGVHDSLQVYTFPVGVKPSIGDSITTEFVVDVQGEVFTKEYMQQFLEQEPLMQRDIPLRCEGPKKVLKNSNQSIKCSITDTRENTYPVTACTQNNICKIFSQNKQEHSFMLDASTIGMKTVTLETKNDQVVEKYIFSYKVEDEVEITIKQIHLPAQMSFEDVKTLEFVVTKTSSAIPKNITITIRHPTIFESWSFSELTKNKKIQLVIPAKQLVAKNNTFAIEVSYSTNLNNSKQVSANASTFVLAQTTKEQTRLALNAFCGGVDEKITRKIFSKPKTPQQRELQRVMTLIGLLVGALLILWLVKKGIKTIKK